MDSRKQNIFLFWDKIKPLNSWYETLGDLNTKKKQTKKHQYSLLSEETNLKTQPALNSE